MTSRIANRLVGVSLLSMGLMQPTAVFAQSQAQAVEQDNEDSAATGTLAEAATEAEPAGGLDRIVVTAQRRQENLQDVPVSVVAVGKEALDAGGINSIMELDTVISGFNTRSNVGAAQFFIRGIGTTANNVENPVALYIDGVYIADQREAAIDLADVEQISVLKGPQGTLFGRNATGGVVQVSTREPTQRLSAEANVGIDNYATLRTSAYLAGGLAENVAASITAQYVTQGDGWATNRTTGEDTYYIENAFNVRGKLVADLGLDTSLTLSADYQDRANRMGPNFRPFPGTELLFPGYQDDGDFRDTYGDVTDTIAVESGGGSATFVHDFGGVELEAMSAYRRGDNHWRADSDATPVDAQTLDGSFAWENTTHELRLSSTGSDGIQWQFGAFYFWGNQEADPFMIRFGDPLAPDPDSLRLLQIFGSEDTEAIAGFGQVTIPLGESTAFTGGLRYTHESRDFFSQNVGTFVNGVTVPLGPEFTDDLSDGSWTWRLALDHEFSDNFMAYVSWNRGFKSGGFNLTNGDNPPYDPETLDSYEVGFKSELLDRNLRLNVGAFYYDYTNIQVVRFTTVSIVENGAKAEVYGIEADVEASFTPDFYGSLGVSVLDATFESFPGATFSRPLPGGGVEIFPGDASGNDLPFAQPLQITASLNYDMDTDFGDILFNVTNSYNDGFYPEANNLYRQNAYNYLNLSATWTSPDGVLDIKLWATNLFDETVLSTINTANVGIDTTYANPPRRFGITAGVQF